MIRPTLLGLLLSLSCCTSPGTADCPVDLDMMGPVMIDLHLAEALSIEIPFLVRDSILEVYFDKVLQDHQLDRTEFDSLMRIIRSEPVWVDSLYTRVGEDLARIETEKK